MDMAHAIVDSNRKMINAVRCLRATTLTVMNTTDNTAQTTNTIDHIDIDVRVVTAMIVCMDYV